VAIIVAVVVLAGTFSAVVRLLSTSPRGAAFGRPAAVAGAVVCVGFLGVAFTPLDRAFRLHMVSSLLAFYSFPVATALLAVATLRDGRFRARAMLGWATLTGHMEGTNGARLDAIASTPMRPHNYREFNVLERTACSGDVGKLQ
jgi:hypothetical protein